MSESEKYKNETIRILRRNLSEHIEKLVELEIKLEAAERKLYRLTQILKMEEAQRM